MPFGIQPIHLIIVLIVALIIFGPSRLPELGRGLGRAMNEFRRGTKEMMEGFSEEVKTPDQHEEAGTPLPQTAKTENGTFCTRCGSLNPPDSHYCSKCGAQLAS